MKISLNTDTWCALVLTVIDVEGVGLQNISVISVCSVAQCCGNSAREKQTVSVELTLQCQNIHVDTLKRKHRVKEVLNIKERNLSGDGQIGDTRRRDFRRSVLTPDLKFGSYGHTCL